MSKSVESERNKLVKRRHVLEAQRKALAEKLKPIEQEINELDDELIGMMLEAGEERVELAGGLGVRLSSSIVASVKDWDETYAWIHKHKAYWLLERRIGVTAFREIIASGKSVPGIEPFTKTKVALVGGK